MIFVPGKQISPSQFKAHAGMAARRQPYRHIYILPMDLHSGHHLVEDQKATETQIDTPVKKFGTESDSKLRRSYIECQHNMIWFSSSLCTFDILVRLSCSNNYKHYLKTGKYTVHNGTFINRAMFTKSFV
ncbi:uncharacterized protein LOC123908817 [Trifolium pratense]|uniref:uncharacterized protein LOC123908817 n=1 Tax=Trifolium pratense TaxID=57577 RepID=UPI001E691B94|nr:uncharacterized protein LOC123908817 [Trifolium pratense]